MNKSTWWIPGHLETKKGVTTDDTLRGAGSKLRSGDSRMGQPLELSAEFIGRVEETRRIETS